MATEKKMLNCIMCPMGCELTVTIEDGAVTEVTGNTCPRGAKYGHDEIMSPTRMLTTTVKVEGGQLALLPVVSKSVLPKGKILDCAKELKKVTVKAPVKAGDVVAADILGLGIDIVASRDMAAV
ncbi:DUF1667 domain-containing protein [Schwartzia succinivorans]|jgi:CxxC motif-containing protein|uniref:CxxC motif-containing protein n=1 Tax=Schwartzia succinivorans DSM 10502 TaxID=1123243 RepID=A0A1M4SSR1_9FIRM|nr:DUF1667 domain-containing protein [Schwartzia succinivorans]SHE35226.1 CxxC motif-containing protein [Schwartzia succinivorans DSM 10502]